MNYEISLPILEDLSGYKELLFLDPSSPRSQRASLDLIAQYFKKEFRYDHRQYDADDHRTDCTGVLICEKAMDLVKDSDHFPNRVIGGACFWAIDSNNYCLDWVWLHPFARNRHKLSELWPRFKEKYGSFTVTHPLSAHMESFLKKHQ